MPKFLPERFVQHSVAAGLNDRYYRRRAPFVNTEVYTRLKRADVLLAFMRARGRPYVVVVEAKSRTTIHQLKLKHNRTRADWTGRILSLLLIGALSAILGYQWYFNATNTLILLSIFLLGSVGISALVSRLRLNFVRSISAIEQLGRYPANESWIAVGSDTFADPADLRTLTKQCRKNGVGLIIVNERGKLKLRVIPRPRHTFNDYLNRYGKRDEILAQIRQQKDYGPTPPERRQNRRRFVNIVLLLGLTGLLVLLVYEREYGPVVPDPFASPAEVVIGPRAVGLPELPAPSPKSLAPAPTKYGTPLYSTAPPCNDVGLNEQAYIVVDAVLNPEAAEVRKTELRAAGMRGHETTVGACIDGAPPGTVVIYTGKIYSNRLSAEAAAKGYRRIVDQLGVAKGIPQVRQLVPG